MKSRYQSLGSFNEVIGLQMQREQESDEAEGEKRASELSEWAELPPIASVTTLLNALLNCRIGHL